MSFGRKPDTDKETRMGRQQGRFEAGRNLLPREAPWLADFESELLAFPGSRYDDQRSFSANHSRNSDSASLQPMTFCAHYRSGRVAPVGCAYVRRR
jgi:phage terminase large subunit-like protein